MKNIFHGYLTDMAIETTKLDIKEKHIDSENENVLFCPPLHFHFETMMWIKLLPAVLTTSS